MTPTPSVHFYTKPQCVQCHMTNKELDKAGFPFKVEDLSDPANLAAAKELGFASPPVVMVGDDGWAGFRPDKIKDLVARINAGGEH